MTGPNAQSGAPAGAMWGGRFDAAPDALFRAINDSLPIDWRLVRHDLAGSIAWARGLAGAGVLSHEDAGSIIDALYDLAHHADTIDAPPTDSGAEDVHTWVEMQLIERVGDLGKKLHTGRSRNDQVATDLRLWTRDAIDARRAELAALRHALLDLADREAATPFPAFTHLQTAQPIVFGHWALAYERMLARDAERLAQARARVNRCPLGCAALAGTTYPVDRDALAAELGFDAPCLNSLDAVADRDFVCETLSVLSLLSVHLSRLAEDLIIYASGPVRLVSMDDAVTSGSSLMPQKRNPDALELIRGYAGRIIAAELSLLVTLKAQPLAYNKDLQEDKPALFGSMDAMALVLPIARRVVEGLAVRRPRALELAAADHADATDLADVLVAKGLPFREAHDRVGRLVKLAESCACSLSELSDEQLQSVVPGVVRADLGPLAIDAMLARRDALGGTAPARVAEALAAARDQLTREHPPQPDHPNHSDRADPGGRS